MAHREQTKVADVQESVERVRPLPPERTAFRRSERIVLVALAEKGKIASLELLSHVRGTSEGSALIALNQLERDGLVESTWLMPDPEARLAPRRPARRQAPEPVRLCALSERGRRALTIFGVKPPRSRRRT